MCLLSQCCCLVEYCAQIKKVDETAGELSDPLMKFDWAVWQWQWNFRLSKSSLPNIPFVELDDAPVASDSASVTNSYNPDDPDSDHLCQSKQIWECHSGCLHRTNNVTYTFGPKQIPICVTKLFHKKLRSKQCHHLWNEFGDSILNTMPFAPPTIEDFFASPPSKFTTFAANNCRYSGYFTEIFVTAVSPFFLKAKSEASKEDNPNWHQAMNGPFADEYWKAAKREITSLEGMGVWDVGECEDNMNVINGI